MPPSRIGPARKAGKLALVQLQRQRPPMAMGGFFPGGKPSSAPPRTNARNLRWFNCTRMAMGSSPVPAPARSRARTIGRNLRDMDLGLEYCPHPTPRKRAHVPEIRGGIKRGRS
jgi:hypothetical protein